MYRPIDYRFFDIVGYPMDAVMTWGYRSWSDEFSTWYVSKADAKEFCFAIGADPAIAEI